MFKVTTTDLYLAINDGNLEQVKAMFEDSSIINKIDHADIEGNTPLHLAVMKRDEEMVRLLLSKKVEGFKIHLCKADISMVNQMGNTPLHLAYEVAHEGIINALLLYEQRHLHGLFSPSIMNNDGLVPKQCRKVSVSNTDCGFLKQSKVYPSDYDGAEPKKFKCCCVM
jgi:ankyrin repeat protein